MLNGNTDDLFAQRDFGRRMGAGDRPAILVVDLQVGLTQPGWPLYGDHDDAIAATRALVETARSAAVPVIFTVVAYSSAELALRCYPILDKMPAMRGLDSEHETARVDPRLAPAADEPVLVKKGQSAFIGTPLAQILLGLRVDTLLVCGANTSGCVRGTVMDASALGYRILLVDEALGDVTQQVHDASIYDMDAKNGDLTSLQNAQIYLHDLPAPVLPAPGGRHSTTSAR